MFLSLVAHAILRIGAGVILLTLSVRHLKGVPTAHVSRTMLRTTGVAELILGISLTLGFLTQVAALATALFAVVVLFMHKRFASYLPSPSFFILLIAASLSLVITGAGALAIDMPF